MAAYMKPPLSDRPNETVSCLPPSFASRRPRRRAALDARALNPTPILAREAPRSFTDRLCSHLGLMIRAVSAWRMRYPPDSTAGQTRCIHLFTGIQLFQASSLSAKRVHPYTGYNITPGGRSNPHRIARAPRMAGTRANAQSPIRRRS